MKIVNKKRFFSSIIVFCISILVFISILDNNKVSAEGTMTPSEESKEPSEKQEETILDNSGYISLENDSNASDAAIVVPKILYDYDLEDTSKTVYLTFDDGPSTRITDEVLDILDRNNIKATFFVVGDSIEKNPDSEKILKRMAKDGHAIGIHSYSHNYKYLYPNRIVNVENFMGEFDKTLDLLKDKLGNDFDTRLVRFPGGHMSWNTENIDAVLADRGIVQVDWNALSGDAEGKGKSVNELQNKVLESSENKNKVILLMHDTNSKETTAQALQGIIDYYKDQGYEFKTLK